MDTFIQNLFEWLVDNLGWSLTVHFKDLLTFLAGAVASALVLLLFLSKIFLQIKKVSTEISFLKMELEGKTLYISNPNTFLDSLETILLVFRYRFSRQKTIRITVDKNHHHRGVKILAVILILILVSILVGVILIWHQIPQQTLTV